jgi:hypothetical protein
MEPGDEEYIKKTDLVWQALQNGLAKAGAITLMRGTQTIDDALFQVWMETIDLIWEQLSESPEDFDEWKQQSPDEKYKEPFEKNLFNYESFIGDAQSLTDVAIAKLSNSKPPDKENARKIISRAFSRAANSKVENGIELEPGQELMSSEKIAELGITKKNLLDSLLMDPQVESVDCVEGEFILATYYGEIKFRLVFGDEASGGKS